MLEMFIVKVCAIVVVGCLVGMKIAPHFQYSSRARRYVSKFNYSNAE